MSDSRFDANANPYMKTSASMVGRVGHEYPMPVTCPYCHCGPIRMQAVSYENIWTTLKCPKCSQKFKIRPKIEVRKRG